MFTESRGSLTRTVVLWRASVPVEQRLSRKIERYPTGGPSNQNPSRYGKRTRLGETMISGLGRVDPIAACDTDTRDMRLVKCLSLEPYTGQNF